MVYFFSEMVLYDARCHSVLTFGPHLGRSVKFIVGRSCRRRWSRVLPVSRIVFRFVAQSSVLKPDCRGTFWESRRLTTFHWRGGYCLRVVRIELSVNLSL